MTAYIIRRVLYTVPLVLGVILFTFILFDVVFSPADRVAQELGKAATEQRIQEELKSRGWDKPLLFNPEAEGLQTLTETRFADYVGPLVTFDFGYSEKTHEHIGTKIRRSMVPSLTLTVPIFILALLVSISLSLTVAFFRATYLDIWVVVICVVFMSVSILVYIIAGQFLLAEYMRLFPVYGFGEGVTVVKFLLLPIIIGVLKNMGSEVRFYRTVMLEQMNQDYVRTARAKGLSERLVLFKHVLKNAMIPILTRTVLAIPFLFLGSLLLEKFFGIPGLGSVTVEAVTSGDTRVLAAVVYIGALLYVAGNLATDISYTFVDPRVRLG